VPDRRPAGAPDPDRKGHEVFGELEIRSQEEVTTILGRLSHDEQGRLVTAMCTVGRLLGERLHGGEPFILRPHRSGDMGWIIYRHGLLYAQEYGWDESFEILVAEIVTSFIRNLDSRVERCWIAERDGGIVGSVFLAKESEEVARLRLLYVEPEARGLGIGSRLVEECMRFARQAGYRKVTLWTNDVLVSARRIYEAAGFRLVREEPHHSFGHDLVGQTWERELGTVDPSRMPGSNRRQASSQAKVND
jgi:GNAT superfamily N-acetyltransferase